MLTVDTNARIIRNDNLETKYSPKDFVNPSSFEREGHQGTGRAYVILNAGYVQAIVFGEYYAYCEQDALDQAVDSGKLDGLLLTEEELKDYEVGTDSEGYPEYEGIARLGNASEPFDSESLDIWVLPAELFEEEASLMSVDRVMAKLEERMEELRRAYDAVDSYSPDWSESYRALQDSEDAITLFRLMCLHRD